ncbi:hypothetical protein NEOLEDRAFT_1178691 [Neolentinus lepideus HHB14362 ss-1]|uniref:DUF4502 domain-containing protein n=1 Tax=Neolentinus lepideus HHB14362 ss-1 TaxID=1314782 RepID=A0A165SBH3_9AGAM|nr:hypothetical protein NEOLEDRAFT_1178691 [Neolentinus lepideus HHB14362 ss-1]
MAPNDKDTRPAKRPRLFVPLSNPFVVDSQPKPVKKQGRPTTFISDFNTPLSRPKSTTNAFLRPPKVPQLFDEHDCARPKSPTDAKGKAPAVRVKTLQPPTFLHDPEKLKPAGLNFASTKKKITRQPDVFLAPSSPPHSKPSSSANTARMHRLSTPALPPPTPHPEPLVASAPLRTPAFPVPASNVTPGRSARNALLSFPTPVLSEPSTPRRPRIMPLTSLTDVDVPDVAPEPEEVTHLIHGSPSKKKFIRGGLADRASALLTRAQTALSLWHHDTRHHSNADLHLSVVRIVQHTPRAVLAVCEDSGGEEKEERIYMFLRREGEREVREAGEVLVWRPWVTVELGSSVVHSGSVLTEVVFCSRFVVVT